MKLNFKRILRHFLTTKWQLHRTFPKQTLKAIEQEIKTSESAHVGEIRMVIECALKDSLLYSGLSSRQRASDLFSHLRMWDTDERNGVLIYILFADCSVEIVADRGVRAKTGAPEWEKICSDMEAAFRSKQYEAGAIGGIRAVTHVLTHHFPSNGAVRNQLPDKVIVM